MKKIIIISVFLVNIGCLFSNPINKETAHKIAINFMSKIISDRTSSVKDIILEYYHDTLVYYVVNIVEGGWVMVSADDYTVPVLGYSLDGYYSNITSHPPAFQAWILSYNNQILKAKKLKRHSQVVKDKWNNLINPMPLKSLIFSYIPNTALLNTPDRGEVRWGQERNNDFDCTPSFNKFCPASDGGQCVCDHKPAGCGAVAMGQIMWYWQWPHSSTFRNYDWDLMTDLLTNSSTDDIPHLLADIGEPSAANMNYHCRGTWATTESLVDGFINKFKYQAAEKKLQKDWTYGNAWRDLIRAEIDAGRPVILRGGEVLELGDMGNVHYFVCDGHQNNDPLFFHINWGWRGFQNSYFTLDDLTPDPTDPDDNYNDERHAIIGISPTCNQVPENIYDVSYTSVSNFLHEQARNNISLPADTKNLTVESGGKLIHTAGNSIILKPGFTILDGGVFRAEIRSVSFDQMNINVHSWINLFTPNGDAINDELCYVVDNANTFEITVINTDNEIIFQNAGTIPGSSICVWDGTGTTGLSACRCIVKFRNSCGEVAEKDYVVTVDHGGLKSFVVVDSTLKNPTMDIISKDEPFITIYPNPNNGTFNMQANNIDDPYNIQCVNSLGEAVYERNNLSFNTCEINLNSQSSGVYILKVSTKDKLFTMKIIINK